MTPSSKAEALFASSLQPSEHPSWVQVDMAIQASLREHGGLSGCAAVCAAEYGDHPEMAVARMRWALDTVKQATAPADLALAA